MSNKNSNLTEDQYAALIEIFRLSFGLYFPHPTPDDPEKWWMQASALISICKTSSSVLMSLYKKGYLEREERDANLRCYPHMVVYRLKRSIASNIQSELWSMKEKFIQEQEAEIIH